MKKCKIIPNYKYGAMHMDDLFSRLHEELLNPDCDAVCALRLAHSIAKHNNLNDFDLWIQNELNGYKCSVEELPDYRRIRGSINAFNPFLGKWIPCVVEDKKMEEMLSTAPIMDSISAIIQLCKDSKGDTYLFRYRGDVHRQLEQWVDSPEGMDIQLHVNIAHIYAIVENVKNRLLEWTIENNAELNENKIHIANDSRHRSERYSKVFIVHGHDGELRESVARIIEKQGIIPIVLFEQPNQGATIIEKFENNSEVNAAICLFTADDMGKGKNEEQIKLRARQNVVFESGFFIGKLGRSNIIIVADDDVELPSDLQGVVYTNTNNWRFDILKELKAMGYSIDYNKLDD